MCKSIDLDILLLCYTRFHSHNHWFFVKLHTTLFDTPSRSLLQTLNKPVIKTLTSTGAILSTTGGVQRQNLSTVTTTQGGKQTIVIAAPRSGANNPGQPTRIVTTVPKTVGEFSRV